MIDLSENIKEKVSKVISELPESCSYEDIFYKLYVMQKFEAGLTAIENGNFLTEEQIYSEQKKWLE